MSHSAGDKTALLDKGEYLSFRPILLRGLLAWTLATLGLIGGFIWIQWKNNETALHEKAAQAYESVHEKIQINEAVLEGFAALLRLVGDQDLEQVRRFTEEMRLAYPHIYMLEAQTAVSNQEAFEQSRREAGYPNYSIKRFSYEGNRGWHDVTENPVYYPIHFIDPMGTDADQVLGLDILSVSFLHDALISAIQSGEAVASKPFTLVEGGNAYVLFKALTAKLDFDPLTSDIEESTVVSLLIETEELLHYASQTVPYANVQLLYRHSDGEDIAERYEAKASDRYIITLGNVEFRRTLDDFGQPFVLLVASPNGLSLADLGIALSLLAMSVLGCWLYYQNAHRRYLSDAARNAALKDLAKERENLEQKVQSRTEQLLIANQSLQAKVIENKALTKKLITVQEDEYRNIAREMHDECGQKLTTINIHAKLALEKLKHDDKLSEYMRDIQRIASELYDAMQTLMSKLRPEALDTFGLKAAIEQCLHSLRLKDHGIELTMNIDDGINDVDNEYAITLYRAIQELTNNALKHADPTKLDVSVIKHQGSIAACVGDNGKGMNGEKSKSGFGLVSLSERIAGLNGSIKIDSQPGAGCSIEITIPMSIKEIP